MKASEIPRYTEDQARGEAFLMKEKIKNGEAKDYSEAEKLIEEEKSQEEFSKSELFHTWGNMVGVEFKISQESFEKLSNEEIKEQLYESLKTSIQKTIDGLGISIPDSLLNQLKSSEGMEKIKAQEQVLRTVVEQFSRIPFDTWSYFPKEVQNTKKLNCSGSQLLIGYLLNKNNIKTFSGNPLGHAMNITRLDDGSFWYVDSRMGPGVHKIEDAQLETLEGGIDVIRTHDENIKFETIPISPESDSVSSIISNSAVIKKDIEKLHIQERNERTQEDPDFSHELAIYEENKESFEKLNFSNIGVNLFRKHYDFYDTPEAKNEGKKLDIIDKYTRGANKEFMKLDSELQKSVKQELKTNKTAIAGYFNGETIDALESFKNLSEPARNYIGMLVSMIQDLKNMGYETEAKKQIKQIINALG